MKIKTILKPEELLDVAFRRARKEANRVNKGKGKVTNAKGPAIKRVEISGNYLTKTLDKSVIETSSIENEHEFYKEMVKLIIDEDKLKKSLAHLSASSKLIKKLKNETLAKIHKVKEVKDIPRLSKHWKKFYARVSSIIKKLSKSIEYIQISARKMKELPDIKFDRKTAILAGFPNTGKTTLLVKITGSKAEVNSYAFTTKRIQLGYFRHKYVEYQLIDTPGLLDRPNSERNDIENKTVSAMKNLADAVVFVFDPTENCGYPIYQQIKLYRELKKDFLVIVVFTKKDLERDNEFEKLRKTLKLKEEQIVVVGKGIKSTLKDKIVETIRF